MQESIFKNTSAITCLPSIFDFFHAWRKEGEGAKYKQNHILVIPLFTEQFQNYFH